MNKTVLIAAVVLVAVGAIIFFIPFAASGFSFSSFGGKTETNTYPVEGAFTKIEVSSKITDIELKPSQDGTASVVCVEREKMKHTVTVEDGTLKINVTDERAWYERWSLFSPSLSMTIYLPAGAYDALSVTSSTGDVTVPADFSFGEASVTVSTGDVSVCSDVAGKFAAVASTGDVSLEGIRTGEIGITVSTGKVNVKSVSCEGDLFVKVSTGKTTLTDVTCKKLNTEGSTGDLKLANLTASESITVKRSTGDVTFSDSDAPAIKVETSTGDVTGTIRSGKLFITHTSTGKSRVPDSTGDQRCEITTSTGNIKIELSESGN